MEELAAPWGACLPDKQLLDGRFCQGAALLAFKSQVFTRKPQASGACWTVRVRPYLQHVSLGLYLFWKTQG